MNLKVMKIKETVEEFIESAKDINYLVVNFVDLSTVEKSCKETEKIDLYLGKCVSVINDTDKNNVSIIVKNKMNDKVLIPALRVGVIHLSDYCIKNNIDTVIISKAQFPNRKEFDSVICTFMELLLTNNLVVSLYTEDEGSII